MRPSPARAALRGSRRARPRRRDERLPRAPSRSPRRSGARRSANASSTGACAPPACCSRRTPGRAPSSTPRCSRTSALIEPAYSSGSATLARMSHTCSRRTVAALLVALSACRRTPRSRLRQAPGPQGHGAQRLPRRGPDPARRARPTKPAFEQAAAQRFQTVVAQRLPDPGQGAGGRDPQGQAGPHRRPGGDDLAPRRRRRQGRLDDARHAGHLRLEQGAAEGAQGGGHALPRGRRPRLVRLRGADRAQLRRPRHAARRDPGPQGLQGEGPQDVPRRVHEPLRPADAGRRRAAAARLGRRRRRRWPSASSAS